MQPIDWQPTEHDSGLPTHRRVPSNASSFHSPGHESAAGGAGAGAGGYGATANNAPAPLNPIPDRDFTAGPANFAPVGGYADLARGVSPAPPQMGQMGQMGQMPLTRGPSMARGYDQYGVPLHHQAGGYEAPNPYAYNRGAGY